MNIDELKTFFNSVMPNPHWICGALQESVWCEREYCPFGVMQIEKFDGRYYIAIAPDLKLENELIRVCDNKGRTLERWDYYDVFEINKVDIIKTKLYELSKKFKELKMKLKLQIMEEEFK